MRRNPSLLSFLAVALLVVVSQAESQMKREDHQTFTNKTDVNQITFDVPAATKKLRLRVKVVLQSGKVSWVLRDPNGTAHISGDGSRGHLAVDTGEIDAIAGAWVFEIKLDNASGTSQVNWASQ
jgi:hypothetical protein